ncbi:hypothetical protein NFI96_023949, partial [Prochilodus magdalenae]
VLISSISGIVVEMRVKPGDNATIYCDCTQRTGSKIIWLIEPSHEHQPPLIRVSEDSTPPRYSFEWNYTKGTYDLLMENITESDLGLYYCALHEIKFTRGRNGERVREESHHKGNRSTFLSFLGVLISSISGVIVEMRVKPGDDATIYCDCTRQHRFKIAWLRNCSHRQQPPLIMSEDLMRNAPPRYSFVWNIPNTTFDLLVRNVSESDLGLYYCALHEMKFTRNRNGEILREDVYHDGNRTTFLSFLGESVHSDLLVLLIWVSVKKAKKQSISSGVDPQQIPSASDCSVCWKLLVSVCTVGVLLTSTCVYHIYRSRTNGTLIHLTISRTSIQVGDGGSDGGGGVGYASLDILSSGQRRLKKRTDESSDLCTYSEVKFVKKFKTSEEDAGCSGGVWISSISGVIVEMRVKPGDNATIYSDCTQRTGYILEWLMKPLDEHQPPLIRLSDPNHPRYSRVWNNSTGRYDLLVKNITESDLGLYYCALYGIKVTIARNGERVREDVYHEGNRTTFLSFLVTITDVQRAVVSSMSHPVSAAPSADGCTMQDYRHQRLQWCRTRLSWSDSSRSSLVMSPTLVLVEMTNESVCGGTVVSIEIKGLLSHVQKTWCPSTSTPTAPSAGPVHVPLTWTNQISAKTSASKTLALVSPPAPVSVMERSRDALITLMCVLISSISGIIVEMRVKPGDDATIYCDCTRRTGYKIAWIIKPSHENQPPLIRFSEDTTPPRYSCVWNNTKGKYNLLVENIRESDLGLYYCALHAIKITRNENGERVREDIYHDGNRTTFLSFLGESVHSDLLVLLIWVSFKSVLIASISGLVVEMRVKPGDNATIYCDCPRSARHTVIWLRKSSHNLEPPLIHFTEDSELPRYSFEWNSSSLTYDLLVENITESDLGLYYCALNTSGGRLPDVYYEGNRTTFLSFLADGAAERRGNMEMRNHDEVEDDEDEYDDFEDSVDIPSNEQTDLKKGTAEDSDLIYSEVFGSPGPLEQKWRGGKSYDLFVKNVMEKDLGLYYCARREKDLRRNITGYHYGNLTTRILLRDTTAPCADLTQTSSTPPVSDCSVCWKLLVSVCPVCVLLSSVVSSTCVYWIYRSRTKGTHSLSLSLSVGGGDVCYAALDLPSRGQKPLKKKKRRVESSELSTYSEVQFNQDSKARLIRFTKDPRPHQPPEHQYLWEDGDHSSESLLITLHVFHNSTLLPCGNYTKGTYDLMVKNINESRLGLYY